MNIAMNSVALLIVALCGAYALRTLLPQTWLARITGNRVPQKKSCGDCCGCESTKPADEQLPGHQYTAKPSAGKQCH
jgi:hypothetical protein